MRASTGSGRMVRALALALAASLVTAPMAAAAPGKASLEAAADVETAEQLYAKLDYERANAVAERVVEQSGLSHDELVRAYRVLAVTYAVLGKEDDARDAFLKLLTYDPDYQADPNLGPKVNTPFVEARGRFRSLPSKPGIDVSATVTRQGGTLRVTTRDPMHVVTKVNVGYRWTSSGEYTVRSIDAGRAISVELAAPPANRTRLDFYAQALDESDNVAFEAGSPRVPKSAFVEGGSASIGGGSGGGSGEQEPGGSVFSSPVFWIIAGAAVVGGGAASYFLLRPDGPPTQAALSPVIFCGPDRCN